jgi:hypothetical protein
VCATSNVDKGDKVSICFKRKRKRNECLITELINNIVEAHGGGYSCMARRRDQERVLMFTVPGQIELKVIGR